MAIVTHGPKDTIDQILELANALERNLLLLKQQAVDEARESGSAEESSNNTVEAINETFLDVRILRAQASKVRVGVENVRRASR